MKALGADTNHYTSILYNLTAKTSAHASLTLVNDRATMPLSIAYFIIYFLLNGTICPGYFLSAYTSLYK